MTTASRKLDLAATHEAGREAKSLLNNQTFIDTIAYLKAKTLLEFEGLTFRQTEEMKDCNRTLKLINSLEGRIIQIVTDSETALRELTLINEHEESMKR